MTPILLDTGVIVALLDRDEQHHAACVEAVRAAPAPLVTCEAVIAESCHLLRRVPGAANTILENVERGVFRIPMRLEDAAGAVRTLMKRYAKVPMDLADACLVALADALGTGRILTLDHDFEIYQWRRMKPFDVLVELR